MRTEIHGVKKSFEIIIWTTSKTVVSKNTVQKTVADLAGWRPASMTSISCCDAITTTGCVADWYSSCEVWLLPRPVDVASFTLFTQPFACVARVYWCASASFVTVSSLHFYFVVSLYVWKIKLTTRQLFSDVNPLILWGPLLPYWYSYKASCTRTG